jgi:lipoprotein-anchoring transpeptidase ErfK/SrfK
VGGYYRQRRRKNRAIWAFPATGMAALALWYINPTQDAPDPEIARLALGPQPVLTTDRPEIAPKGPIRTDVSEKGATQTPTRAGTRKASSRNSKSAAAGRASSLIAAGKQALARKDLVAARAHFSEAMTLDVDDAQANLVRAELTRLGNELIFSGRILPSDPLVSRYIIKTGDSLAKIAKENSITDDLLAEMNGIRNKNIIRAGQSIKIVKGPFHAKVDKNDYSLDIYLGTTFVKHFRVGLGLDDSTPTGQWKVSTKLKNPTFYPPRGGDIVAANDPDNPLGERWIGLTGVSGEAVGQRRYGIHGTNEPESIGQSVSMGCVRMHNADVESVYSYLIESKSIVTITD